MEGTYKKDGPEGEGTGVQSHKEGVGGPREWREVYKWPLQKSGLCLARGSPSDSHPRAYQAVRPGAQWHLETAEEREDKAGTHAPGPPVSPLQPPAAPAGGGHRLLLIAGACAGDGAQRPKPVDSLLFYRVVKARVAGRSPWSEGRAERTHWPPSD